MAIYVNNLQDKVEIAPDLVELLHRVGEATLARFGHGEAEAGITLADDPYLHELNREYRGIDAPTDVLSFGLREETPEEPAYLEPGPEVLGDVVISAERAVAQAAEYDHSLARELAYLAVHGLLHLLGYDHDRPEEAEEMRRLEEDILNAQGLKRDAAAEEHHREL
ncbi:MAG: rRNA maturation RNase YbeY [Firmicutes bacterium]|nr:rRNA maturation RNase YbeY [Bacillota bacterium]